MAARVGLALACLLAGLSAPAADAGEERAECAPARAEEGVPHTALLQHKNSVLVPPEPGSTEPAQGRPNIVLFLTGELHLASFAPWLEHDFAPEVPASLPAEQQPVPADESTTPNLARIARSGAAFTNVHSTSSASAPSRFSVLTGRYPSRSGFGQAFTRKFFPEAEAAFVGGGTSLLDARDGQDSVARALHGLGYATGMVGLWGVAAEGRGASFEDPYEHQVQLVQSAGFDFVDGLYIQRMEACDAGSCDPFSYNLGWMTERALAFMDEAMRGDRPFFLYFAPSLPDRSAPSAAGAAPETFNASQTPSGVLPAAPDISRYCSSCTAATREAIWAESTESHGELLGRELAGIRWVDESLGVLYDFLTERGAVGNTYVVITTDNGPAKGSLYEMGTRVPLYAAGPGIPSGTLVADLVSHIDVAPTLLEWAGCCAPDSAPMQLDGLSWSPLVSGKASSLGRDEVHMESMLDRAVVRADGLKYYLRRSSYMDPVLADEGDASRRKEVSSRVQHLAALSLAYPSFDEPEQMYNLNIDRLERVNMASPRRVMPMSGASASGGFAEGAALIREHDAATYGRGA